MKPKALIYIPIWIIGAFASFLILMLTLNSVVGAAVNKAGIIRMFYIIGIIEVVTILISLLMIKRKLKSEAIVLLITSWLVGGFCILFIYSFGGHLLNFDNQQTKTNKCQPEIGAYVSNAC